MSGFATVRLPVDRTVVAAIALTMPPWPGDAGAVAVPGPWTPGDGAAR